jgi:amino acid transporter
MEARPKIEVPQTPADKAGEIFAWSALALLWVLSIWSLFTLPDTIPTHFNGAGAPDHYGEKGSLLMLPLVATVLFAVITALSKYPHILNYPAEITPDNALRQYRGAIRLARGLKTGLVLIFLLLVFQTGQVATGRATGLGAWNMPVALGLLFVLPVMYYLATLARAPK